MTAIRLLVSMDWGHWYVDQKKPWVSEVLNKCALLPWACLWQGPHSLRPMEEMAKSFPQSETWRGRAKPSFLFHVWMLTVCAEMSTIAFSPGCLWPEDCSPTETGPTKISWICLLYLCVVISPCGSVVITPLPCSALGNKHAGILGLHGLSSRKLRLSNPTFLSVSVFFSFSHHPRQIQFPGNHARTCHTGFLNI